MIRVVAGLVIDDSVAPVGGSVARIDGFVVPVDGCFVPIGGFAAAVDGSAALLVDFVGETVCFAVKIADCVVDFVDDAAASGSVMEIGFAAEIVVCLPAEIGRCHCSKDGVVFAFGTADGAG